uniref:Uncharacterized protein n=1 Tax=Clastoptera arizonana TaxID=38151 RepID=A0A1B6CVR0_9HEMI
MSLLKVDSLPAMSRWPLYCSSKYSPVSQSTNIFLKISIKLLPCSVLHNRVPIYFPNNASMVQMHRTPATNTQQKICGTERAAYCSEVFNAHVLVVSRKSLSE